MCVCVRERERECIRERREREREKHSGSDVCARARRHHSRGKKCVYTESTLAELAVNKHLLGFFPLLFFLAFISLCQVIYVPEGQIGQYEMNWQKHTRLV